MANSDKYPPNRQYYSVRAGKHPAHVGFDLDDFKRFFLASYRRLEREGLFQEWFGYLCVDEGFVPGRIGDDPDLFIYKKLRKKKLWPLEDRLHFYSEDDLFDVIEFLFDHVSQGNDGYYHDYNGCGWHYTEFKNHAAAKAAYRTELNEVLADYSSGYELSPKGEILERGGDVLEPLLKTKLPHADSTNVVARVESAKLKWLRRGSTAADRRDAVRDLADVLEFLRPQVRDVLNKKDESDLFELANNFGIRHHRQNQQTDYDQAIWYSWMFHYYLATIHACVRLIEKNKASGVTIVAKSTG